jgi:hypothetical protein
VASCGLDDLARYREPEPGSAARGTRGLEGLEAVEEPRGLDADAVVANAEGDRLGRGAFDRDFDSTGPPRLLDCMDGVGQEVREDLRELGSAQRNAHVAQDAYREGDVCAAGQRCDDLGRAFHALPHIAGLTARDQDLRLVPRAPNDGAAVLHRFVELSEHGAGLGVRCPASFPERRERAREHAEDVADVVVHRRLREVDRAVVVGVGDVSQEERALALLVGPLGPIVGGHDHADRARPDLQGVSEGLVQRDCVEG